MLFIGGIYGGILFYATILFPQQLAAFMEALQRISIVIVAA